MTGRVMLRFAQVIRTEDVSVVGEELMRRAASLLGHQPLAEVRVERRPGGAPRIVSSRVNVSLSHSGAIVVAAASLTGAVGVDVERLRRLRDVGAVADRLRAAWPDEPALSERLLTHASAIEVWTRCEAVLKVLGCGLRRDLQTLRASPGGPPWTVHVLGLPTPLSVHPVVLAPGYVGAVATTRSMTSMHVDRQGLDQQGIPLHPPLAPVGGQHNEGDLPHE